LPSAAIERNFTPKTFSLAPSRILLHSNYEEADLEELAREGGFRPIHQTDPGKLAREGDLRPAGDKRFGT
jgi:hypothetical protein